MPRLVPVPEEMPARLMVTRDPIRSNLGERITVHSPFSWPIAGTGERLGDKSNTGKMDHTLCEPTVLLMSSLVLHPERADTCSAHR